MTRWDHSPAWAPWEQHPDPRRRVTHVPAATGSLAATCCPHLAAAMVRWSLP